MRSHLFNIALAMILLGVGSLVSFALAHGTPLVTRMAPYLVPVTVAGIVMAFVFRDAARHDSDAADTDAAG